MRLVRRTDSAARTIFYRLPPSDPPVVPVFHDRPKIAHLVLRSLALSPPADPPVPSIGLTFILTFMPSSSAARTKDLAPVRYRAALLDPRHPLRLVTARRLDALHSAHAFNWSAHAVVASGARPSVRNWVARRVRRAVALELAARGWGQHGEILSSDERDQAVGGRERGLERTVGGDVNVENESGQAHRVGPLRGTAHIAIWAPVRDMDFRTVRDHVSRVVDALVESRSTRQSMLVRRFFHAPEQGRQGAGLGDGPRSGPGRGAGDGRVAGGHDRWSQVGAADSARGSRTDVLRRKDGARPDGGRRAVVAASTETPSPGTRDTAASPSLFRRVGMAQARDEHRPLTVQRHVRA